jgi:hypothetical protein
MGEGGCFVGRCGGVALTSIFHKTRYANAGRSAPRVRTCEHGHGRLMERAPVERLIYHTGDLVQHSRRIFGQPNLFGRKERTLPRVEAAPERPPPARAHHG